MKAGINKLAVHGLHNGEQRMRIRSLVLMYYHCVLDRQTVRHTQLPHVVANERTKIQSVLKSLSYLGRAANLTSAPGGQRSCLVKLIVKFSHL